MAKLTVKDLKAHGKQVFVRVDYNVPLEEQNGVMVITDDTRIRATLPTLECLIKEGAKIILTAHLGRPKGKREATMSLAPVAVRLSELIGKKVVFVNDCIGEEVEKALHDYLEISRNAMTPLSGHEDALFLSGQRRRISVDAVEKMVKKYASAISAKTITPHKLRSTYGTALYRETGDIYLVADVLGHADVNTTKKHYAKLSDARRRAASKAVILREKID